MKYLKLSILALTMTCGILNTWAQNTKFTTDYEHSGSTETPRYEPTVAYCRMLADESPMVSMTSIGRSPQGREIPLLILDRDGLSDAKAIRAKGRSVILLQAAIHAGEPDGKDAGLMLFRDIAIEGKYRDLLNNVTLIFIPILNVDGHEKFGPYNRINQNGPRELGTRATAQGLNLNRDFVKADSPEMRTFLGLYNQWLPELFIDTHVTNGTDFQYVVTYGIDRCGFSESPVFEWGTDIFESKLSDQMARSGFPIFPYFSFRDNRNPDKGILVSNFAPQYSNGYAASRNRLGLLVETHIYKPYQQRVDATYKIILHSMEIVAAGSKELQKAIAEADRRTASAEFRAKPFALDYENTTQDSVMVDFLGWKTKTIKSDLSGADWTTHDYTAPITISAPLYTSNRALGVVKLPEAYIFRPEQLATIEILELHGIKLRRLEKDQQIPVEIYRFTDAQWSKYPYEGRTTVKAQYTTDTMTLDYPKGSVVVEMNQPTAKIIAHLLEPNSPTSLLYWGFYNPWVRFSSEFWVSLGYMEVKGREMMASDPALKAEFEARLSSDPKFAADPKARLQFFMDRVRKNVEPEASLYPIARQLKTM